MRKDRFWLSDDGSQLALLTGVCAALVAASVWAQDSEVPTLAPVKVRATSLGNETLDEARTQRQQIPGNVTVVPESRYEDGAVLGMEDALARVPGVYVQNPSGQISARISMRGSGVSSATGIRGVRVLRDGLSLARIDDLSDSIYGDPLGADFIEVLRGANAMIYGAATLGGALNLVSPSGRSQPGLRLRLDGGAYGYRSSRAQWGQSFGNGWDAFVAANSVTSNGAREHSAYNVNRFYGNVGYEFSPRSRGRLHFTQEYFKVHVPGAITREQLEDDPRVANPSSQRSNARIRTSPRWHVAYVHEWDMNARDSLSVGVFHTGTRYHSWGTVSDVSYDAVDYGLALRHEMHGLLAGRESELAWGVNLGRGRDNNGATWPALLGSSPLLPPAGSPQAAVAGQRSNIEAFAQWTLRIAPRWSLVLGGQGVRAERSTDNQVSPLARAWFADGTASRRYTGFSPRLGFVWDVAPDAQVFGNLSGSYEPPNSVNFFTPDGLLKAQRATTLELGSRGGKRKLGWEAAVYYARVRNELIEAPLPGNAGVMVARNADKTRHMGLELGLFGEVRLSSLPGRFHWAVAYTWNDFRFDADPVFGNNRLPGIPTHVMRLDLRYQHPSGFYAGPSMEIASGWNVDQANTVRAPGYGILNLSAGYQSPDERWRLYVDLRNLTDRHYAAATEYIIDAQGQGNLPVYFPGASRTVFAGLEWRW